MRLKVITVIIFELIFVASVMLDAFAGGALHQHGIHPRDFPMGLLGVLFAPFLHKGLGHWLVNAVPFFVLSMLVLVSKALVIRIFVYSLNCSFLYS